MCINVYIYVYMYVCVCVCACTCVNHFAVPILYLKLWYIYVYKCVNVYIYVYVYVCVCVCVCTCVNIDFTLAHTPGDTCRPGRHVSNIVSFIGLFCKRDLYFIRILLIVATL